MSVLNSTVSRLGLPAMGLALALSCASAWADDLSAGAVAHGPAGPVSADDVLLMVEDLIAPAERAVFWSRPDAVGNFVSAIYGQRALAQQAVAEGLEQAPRAARQLQLLQNRALTNILLAQRGQAALPSDQVLTSLARADYNANPDKYTEPEQLRVRHILLPVAEGQEGRTVELRARAMRQQLQAGGDFAALAKEHSSDTNSARKGGELAFFAKGRMEPEFEAAAFALKTPGDLSEPVQTRFGWHLIELLERKPASQRSFEEVLPELRAEIEDKLDGQERSRVWGQATAATQLDVKALEALARQQLDKLGGNK